MILSVVPKRRVKDPRQLLYHYPSISAQRYAKLVANFHNDQMVKMAEEIANGLGFLLVPACCLHWKFKIDISGERKVQVGRFSFYMLKKSEMTKRAYQKFLDYIAEIQNEGEGNEKSSKAM